MDSFLSASSKMFTDEAGRKQQFAYRPVVATCDLSSTARCTLENQVPPAGTLYVRELEDMGIDWSLFWEQFDKNVLSGEGDDTDGHIAETVRSEKKSLH